LENLLEKKLKKLAFPGKALYVCITARDSILLSGKPKRQIDSYPIPSKHLHYFFLILLISFLITVSYVMAFSSNDYELFR